MNWFPVDDGQPRPPGTFPLGTRLHDGSCPVKTCCDLCFVYFSCFCITFTSPLPLLLHSVHVQSLFSVDCRFVYFSRNYHIISVLLLLSLYFLSNSTLCVVTFGVVSRYCNDKNFRSAFDNAKIELNNAKPSQLSFHRDESEQYDCFHGN